MLPIYKVGGMGNAAGLSSTGQDTPSSGRSLSPDLGEVEDGGPLTEGQLDELARKFEGNTVTICVSASVHRSLIVSSYTSLTTHALGPPSGRPPSFLSSSHISPSLQDGDAVAVAQVPSPRSGRTGMFGQECVPKASLQRGYLLQTGGGIYYVHVYMWEGACAMCLGSHSIRMTVCLQP